MSWTTGLEHVLSEQVALAERTWLGLGGAAAWLARPTTSEELIKLVQRCREEDMAVRLLGGGSNLLIREAGVSGVVLSLDREGFRSIAIRDNTITCGGGAKLAHLVSEAVGAGLSGLEPLVGIPGTVGGALHGNAGSHGGDIGQWTVRATVLTRGGELVHRQRGDLVFAYRQSSLDELVILDAEFELEPDDPQALARRMQKLWISTKASQPPSHERTACVFKDPPGLSAEMLIEQSGLKGAAVGGVELSSRHTNFLVAHPGAKIGDALALIDMLRDAVMERTGVELPLQLEIW